MAEACRAHVSLRDVLLGEDMDAVKAGIERLRLDMTDGLDASPRARWPLDPDAPAVSGTNHKKGGKR